MLSCAAQLTPGRILAETLCARDFRDKHGSITHVDGKQRSSIVCSALRRSHSATAMIAEDNEQATAHSRMQSVLRQREPGNFQWPDWATEEFDSQNGVNSCISSHVSSTTNGTITNIMLSP